MASITHKQAWNRKFLIPFMIACAICYSCLYNYILLNAVQRDVDQDAECIAQPGSGDLDSPHCSEVRLFRSWHDAEVISEESDESLLVIDVPANAAEEEVKFGDQDNTAGTSAKIFPVPPSETSVNHRMSQTIDSVAHAEEDIVIAPQQTQAQRTRLRRKRFDELEKRVRDSLNHSTITPWAKSLTERQKQLEAEMQVHDSHHHATENAAISEWQGQVDDLEKRIHEAIPIALSQSNLTTLKHRLELQMNVHMSRSPSHQEKVLQLMQAQLSELEGASHTLPYSPSNTPWDKLGSIAFDLKQMRLHLEFKMSSHTLVQHSSSKRATHEQLQARHAEHTKRTEGLTKEIGERMTSLESGLADLVADRKSWESKLLTRYNVSTHRDSNLRGMVREPHTESVTARPASFLEKRLHWSSVKALSHSIVTGHARETKVVVGKRDVRHLHWAGAIPKVSCITAISYSRHVRARMMYFIDNFKLQDYEGPRQLLLVYHYLDTDAAELVQKYADGFYIKGVAARGDHDFPSNAALRYGAWSADADIIARWDFEEWHDPSRLTMQVRAMAATSRPACILQDSHSGPKKVNMEEQVVHDLSLVGERSWMKAYWQPFSAKDEVSPPPAHVVQLNMRNLQSGNDESRAQVGPSTTNINSDLHSVTSTTQAGSVEADHENSTMREAAHEWTMKECLDLDTLPYLPSPTAEIEASIDKSLGHGMSETFHKLLARRHDITQKLQLLCMETTMERDTKEHIFKRQHVEQMLGIRNELDKHITGTAAVFANTEKFTSGEILDQRS
jgi:hypothetical protein